MPKITETTYVRTCTVGMLVHRQDMSQKDHTSNPIPTYFIHTRHLSPHKLFSLPSKHHSSICFTSRMEIRWRGRRLSTTTSEVGGNESPPFSLPKSKLEWLLHCKLTAYQLHQGLLHNTTFFRHKSVTTVAFLPHAKHRRAGLRSRAMPSNVSFASCKRNGFHA